MDAPEADQPIVEGKSQPANETEPQRPKSNSSRQSIILAIGVLLIILSLGIRNSGWAKERRLKTLNFEDLALASHDEPDDPLTLVYYGDALIRTDQAADAAKVFKHAADIAPANEHAQLGLASAQLRLNELPLAAESFGKAIKLDPRDKGAYLGLAQTLDRQGSAAEAAQQLKKALEIDPSLGTGWYYLGKMYIQIGDTTHALDAMQHAVKASPDQALYWRDLGDLSHRSAKLADAEAQLKKSVQISSSDPLALLWLGQVLLELGDTPELRSQASRSFQDAAQLDPKLQEAVFGMGLVFQRYANVPDAVRAFRRACEMRPSDEKAVRALGNAVRQAGNMAESAKLLAVADKMDAAKQEIDALKAKLALDPRSRDTRLKIARLFRKYGDSTEALKHYALYEHLGVEDTAVRREIEQYQAEQDARTKTQQPSSTGSITDGKP